MCQYEYQIRWYQERYSIDAIKHDLNTSYHLPESSENIENSMTPHSNANPLPNNSKQSCSAETVPRHDLQRPADRVVGSAVSVPLVRLAHRRAPDAGAEDAEAGVDGGGLFEMGV